MIASMTADELASAIHHNQQTLVMVANGGIVLMVLVLTAFTVFAVGAILTRRQMVQMSHILRASKAYSEMSEEDRQRSRDRLLGEVGDRVKQAVGDTHPAEIKVIVPPVILDPASGKYKVPEPATDVHKPLPATRPGVILGVALHALAMVLSLGIVFALCSFGHTPAQEPAMPVPLHDHFQTAFTATAAREHGRAAASWAAARAAGGNEVECLLGQADAAFHARDLASAESCAREVIQLAPRHARAHYLLGAVAEVKGDAAGAAKWYILAGRYGEPFAARRLAEVSRR